MQRYIIDIPLYQAGFLRNRSTDGHIFTLRRISEEGWRKGLPTYILSLDLSKAFDMVNTHRLATVLLSYGLPAYLINRIITATLHERTSVQLFGRRTNTCERSKGVKQGCPVSQYIFIVILHYAIKRACDRLNIDLDMNELMLPILLAYADDIIIIGDSLTIFTNILASTELELQEVGWFIYQ